MSALDKFQQALQLMESYTNEILIVGSGGKNEDTIQKAESMLGITFPPSYKKFLRRFGSIYFMSWEFYGIMSNNPVEDVGEAGGYRAIGETLDLRQSKYLTINQQLPSEFLVVGGVGDGSFYCIDTSIVNQEGESPIVLWTPGGNEIGDELEITNEDFGSYFLEHIQDEIENYEE